MAVPYTFGSATTSIPLSQLDSNFATTITLGNTAVQLGNTITTLTGVTNLASSGALTLGSNGNTTAITVSTSQNVGIGATPTQKLQVAGNVFISSGQYFMWDNAGAWALQSDASTYVRTFIAGNEQLRVNAYGIGIGGTTPSSGTGVTFPATQNASSDANTLDDYEEGTWTPTDTSGASLSFTIQSATYVKVGQAVFVYMFIYYPTTASTATAKIGGLPFNVLSSSAQNYQLTGRIQMGGVAYSGQVSTSNSIDPVPMNSFNSGPTNVTLSGSGVIFSGFYRANA